MENMHEREEFKKENKVYKEPNEINEKIKDIEEKLEIAKKQNTQRLCIPFTVEEMKKLEIAFNYRYDLNKKTQIASLLKKRIEKEVEEILKEMKDNFFE